MIQSFLNKFLYPASQPFLFFSFVVVVVFVLLSAENITDTITRERTNLLHFSFRKEITITTATVSTIPNTNEMSICTPPICTSWEI